MFNKLNYFDLELICTPIIKGKLSKDKKEIIEEFGKGMLSAIVDDIYNEINIRKLDIDIHKAKKTIIVNSDFSLTIGIYNCPCTEGDRTMKKVIYGAVDKAQFTFNYIGETSVEINDYDRVCLWF